MSKLFETDHPYYCQEGCYFSTECHNTYGSWSDFLEEWGESDEDMNLVFRWDWRTAESGWIDSGSGDVLMIYFVMQRKAFTISCQISVCRDQEPEIRQWLEKRAERLGRLWEPIAICPSI